MAIEYQKMLLTKTNRIVTTSSKVTMRDNSCIAYMMDELWNIGIVHKIIHIPTTKQTFIIVYPLSPTHNKLCRDEVTNAGIDTHICQLYPLRYCSDSHTAVTIMHVQFCRDQTIAIAPSQVEEKLMLMDQITYFYTSRFPNCQELD